MFKNTAKVWQFFMIACVILLFPWHNRRTVTTVLHHHSEEKAGLLWGRTISLWQIETVLKAAGEIQGNTLKLVTFSIDVPVWGCLPAQEAIRKNSVINCIVDRWVCVLFCVVCMLFVCLFFLFSKMTVWKWACLLNYSDPGVGTIIAVANPSCRCLGCA